MQNAFLTSLGVQMPQSLQSKICTVFFEEALLAECLFIPLWPQLVKVRTGTNILGVEDREMEAEFVSFWIQRFIFLDTP